MPRLAASRLLLALLVLDLLLQFFGLWRAIDTNPALLAPAGDSLEYWDWAGTIADGILVGDKPFMSAPLYPYFVGILRALGGGMLSLYVLQLLLRSLTAWLLARTANTLFGHWGFGLATCVLFLWLEEPAYYAVRILNSSLQLFTMAFLLELVTRQRLHLLGGGASAKRSLLVGVGAALGLATLANPSLLIALPFFAWWLGLGRTTIRGTAIAFTACLLVIAPATWHNYLAAAKWPAGGEFIPISAQAGVTFAHGNSAGAGGIYKPVDGVSQNRGKQNDDAYQVALAASGNDRIEGWNYTSSYFRKQGTSYLRENLGAAVGLELQKLRWFFCGRNYGDLYNIALENKDPDWPRQVPLPGGLLQLGWLLPGAFMGLWFLIRRDRRQAIPYATLLLVTWFVVMVFWYSPRYRLPAAPLAAVLAPYGVFAFAAALGRSRSLVVLALLGLAPAVFLESWTRLSGFDSAETSRPQYELHTGLNYIQQGNFLAAIPRLENALQLKLENAEVHHALAEAQVKVATALDLQQEYSQANALYEDAIAHYQRAVEMNPSHLDTWFSLINVLDYMQHPQQALAASESALREAKSQNQAAMTLRLQQQRARLAK